ncbi:hypothetical protein PF005_g132 [Phytophthora fragariae]|uniref:Uncharacterized protein n=2 Tax=Phytophthora fragariae TaxID=53985 RepID=A0A6A3TT58_9STRA|nr:hypothetical protein PF007_g67 [Phytophthora fragariae]KAE9238681.1 hypothetical protein PF005_g132 [Phytophthora fragariae]
MASPGPPLNAALPSRRPQRSQTPTSSQPATTTPSTTRTSNAQGRGSLSMRVLTVEKFRQERLIRSRLNPPPPPPSKAIPVPLYPGETMAQYNHKLDQWLAERHESLESLRDNPKRERQFRLAFAFLRDNRKPSAAGTKTPKRKSIDEEYEEFYRRSASQELKRLRRDTSTERDRSEPRGRSPAHPAEERRLNRDTSSLNREHCSTDKEIAPRSHSRSTSRPRDSRDHPLSSFQMPPRSSHRRSTSPASQSSYQSSHSRSPTEILASRVLSMEDYLQEMKLPKNIRNQRGPGGSSTAVELNVLDVDDFDQTKCATRRELDNQVKECDTTACHLPLDPDKSYVSAAGSKTQVTEKHQTTEDIRHDATITLSRAVDSRAKADLKKRRLTEAYDRLNNQITMNETAIDDALDYIKTIKDVDYAAAMEQHSQVMELDVSINKEREKRASALAGLILYGWKGREDALLSLLAEESSEAHASGGADHERLSTISSQIEDKDGALKSLEAHLKEQLQWVTGISSNVSESDRALRFKALRKLSKRLAKEQTTKEQLERERQEVMESFLQIDTELRKLIKGSLVKNVKNKC